jgi:hypothetical protein
MKSDQVSSIKMPWVLLCGFIVVINILNYGLQSGQCVDYAPGSVAVSYCSSEPALGWPGTVLLAIVSLVALGYCISRMRRPHR